VPAFMRTVSVASPGSPPRIASFQREQTNRSRQSRTGRFGAVLSGHLGGVGLDLMLARLARDDQPDAGRGGDAECHRRAGDGFHGCAIETATVPALCSSGLEGGA
jgi:hypothetical protein